MTTIVVETKDQVISKLCELIGTVAEESIQKNGTFFVGLSGGSLTEFLSRGLPKIKTDFTKWKLFFCDERLVPVDDPESTFGLYKRTLIDSGAVNLKVEQFAQIKQGVSAEEAAMDYAIQMSNNFKDDALPTFDMLLLGMGPDGHTCSLFPGHKLLSEESKWVAPITDSPKPPPSRVTMTYPVINNARFCVFAAAGAGKAAMIKVNWPQKTGPQECKYWDISQNIPSQYYRRAKVREEPAVPEDHPQKLSKLIDDGRSGPFDDGLDCRFQSCNPNGQYDCTDLCWHESILVTDENFSRERRSSSNQSETSFWKSILDIGQRSRPIFEQDLTSLNIL